MPDELLTEAAAAAARTARKAAVLTMLAVGVAVLVLAIDNSIKRAIVAQRDQAQAILDQHRALLAAHVITIHAEGKAGGPETGAGASAARAGRNGSHDVVRDPVAGAVLDTPGGAAAAARPKRAAGAKRGPAGDGG